MTTVGGRASADARGASTDARLDASPLRASPSFGPCAAMRRSVEEATGPVSSTRRLNMEAGLASSVVGVSNSRMRPSTIAHRLDTIIFSDRILAMAEGRMREFDTPTTLLANPASMFNRLVEDTGPVASSTLRRMAAQGPNDGEARSGDASKRASVEAPRASAEARPPTVVIQKSD